MNYLAITNRSIELISNNSYCICQQILQENKELDKIKFIKKHRFILDTKENFEKEDLAMSKRIKNFNHNVDKENKYYSLNTKI